MTAEAESTNESEIRPARMRAERRRQILSAAKHVFAERGYHNASISGIIAQAGIARGTFYLYFSSKRIVFDSLFDEALDELRARITRIDIGEGAEPPQLQLRGSLCRVLDYLVADRDFTTMLLSQGLATDAEVAARVKEFYDHVTALLRSSLDHGIHMGLVRPCDTELIAAALLGAVRGVIGQLLAKDGPRSAEEVVDELIAFALRGVVVSARWRAEYSPKPLK